MNFIRSLAYAVIFYLGSVPIVIAAAIAPMFGDRALFFMPRIWAAFHYWCVRHLLGIKVIVEGVLPQDAVIVAFKHEAMLETIEILRLFDRPAVVFKAELLKIPLWGSAALAHGVIPVARETGATALRRMLKAGKAAIALGRPVIIFPEGTRVPHGERALLRPGLAGLYKSLGVPIIPVAVDSGRLWQRRRFIKRPGVVRMRVGAPIPPGLPREDVEDRVRRAINVLNDQ